MNGLPTHYRYIDAIHEDGLYIHLIEWYPIKETKCFYFCLSNFDYELHKAGVDRSKHTKRISKNGVVRRAYPDKQKALDSYKMRKEAQMRRAREHLNISEYVLSVISEVKSIETKVSRGQNLVDLGRPDFIDNYIFD